MAVKKLEYYEGAALHQLITGATQCVAIHHSPPFFLVNNAFHVYLKYCTSKRSPWDFTLTPEEQSAIGERPRQLDLTFGLICGSEGIVALPLSEYLDIGDIGLTPQRISCKRSHRTHFEIIGPKRSLARRIPPSAWTKLLALTTP